MGALTRRSQAERAVTPQRRAVARHDVARQDAQPALEHLGGVHGHRRVGIATRKDPEHPCRPLTVVAQPIAERSCGWPG